MANRDLTVFMPEKVQEADVSLARSLKEWSDSEVIGKRLEYNEDYDKLLYPAMKKLFLDIEMQKLLWPEKYGGAGYNTPEVAQTMALALEQIGRADTGIGYITASTYALCGTFALESNFNNKLCDTFAPLFCDSEKPVIGSLIVPSYGRKESDPAGDFRGKYLQARAKKSAKSWIVNGLEIRPLNSGKDADIFGVFCFIEDENVPGFILIPGDAPGLKRDAEFLKTGLAASRNSELELRNVEVPLDNLVFKGEEPYRQMISWFNTGVAAVTVGSLFAAYEIIREWGDTRVIKGKGSIFKENPLTASLMADVSQKILLSRMLTHQLAQLLSGANLKDEAENERIYITSLSVASHVTHEAETAINYIMELMGSAGYATEWNLERYWRDVKTMQIHLGNRELNNMDIARYFYGCKTL